MEDSIVVGHVSREHEFLKALSDAIKVRYHSGKGNNFTVFFL